MPIYAAFALLVTLAATSAEAGEALSSSEPVFTEDHQAQDTPVSFEAPALDLDLPGYRVGDTRTRRWLAARHDEAAWYDRSASESAGDAADWGGADTFEWAAANVLYDYGSTAAAVVGALMLTSDQPWQRRAGTRARDAVAVTSLITTLLKATVRDPRPNRPQVQNGFPSGHTSLTFAVARSIAEEDSGWGLAAYTWATAVGWSCIRRGEHSELQVVAGALIGWYVADALAGDDDDSVSPEGPVWRPCVGFKVAW